MQYTGSSHTSEYKMVILISARSEGILDHCSMTEITYYFCCQIQKFKICNLSVKTEFCCFPMLLVWHSLRLVTCNLEGKEARGMGQYLFEYVASQYKTPTPNTLGPRFCSLYTINVCTSRSCWPMSRQKFQPTIHAFHTHHPGFNYVLQPYWPCYGFETCERNKLNFVEMLLHWMHVTCDKDSTTFYLCHVSSNFQSIFFHVSSSVILAGFWD